MARLGAAGSKAFATLLHDYSYLKKVDVGLGKALTSDIYKELAQGLENHPSLTELSLIIDEVSVEDANVFAAALMANKRLTKIVLRYAGNISAVKTILGKANR